VGGRDANGRAGELADGSSVGYDYGLVALGSDTACYGIPGIEGHAHTRDGLDDALAVHDASRGSAGSAPARSVVGGAGLSGVQTAGEVAEYRDEHGAPIDITLIEGLERVLPNGPEPLQDALRRRLDARGVGVITGEFIGEVDAESIYYGQNGERPYDVLVWTGGITGREAVRNSSIERDERSHRINATQTFETSDERVFAIGDCALIEGADNDEPAPPTAQAAWQAAEVAGDNLARAVRGKELKEWSYTDMGTVVSVGEDAVAHDVSYAGIPFPKKTFGGFPARTLKKSIAAKWLKRVAGIRYAVRAWPDM
jgi:NADH dehydrogenase